LTHWISSFRRCHAVHRRKVPARGGSMKAAVLFSNTNDRLEVIDGSRRWTGISGGHGQGHGLRCVPFRSVHPQPDHAADAPGRARPRRRGHRHGSRDGYSGSRRATTSSSHGRLRAASASTARAANARAVFDHVHHGCAHSPLSPGHHTDPRHVGDGTFSEYATLQERAAILIDDDVPSKLRHSSAAASPPASAPPSTAPRSRLGHRSSSSGVAESASPPFRERDWPVRRPLSPSTWWRRSACWRCNSGRPTVAAR